MIKNIILFVGFFLMISCASLEKSFVERPIIFDAQRKALTKQYIQEHYGIAAKDIRITPKMVVLHWTAIPTFAGSFDAFYNPTLPSWRADIKKVGDLNVSSHFLVDSDGTIYRLMPETYMGRHVIGLNYSAIGIENVGGTAEQPLTEAQLQANIALVRYLAKKYDIDYVIGHHEYTLFEGHELWLEQDQGYRTHKTDPGEEFMQNVRKATKNLNFKSLPKTKP